MGAYCWFYYRNNITMHGSMNALNTCCILNLSFVQPDVCLCDKSELVVEVF